MRVCLERDFRGVPKRLAVYDAYKKDVMNIPGASFSTKMNKVTFPPDEIYARYFCNPKRFPHALVDADLSAWLVELEKRARELIELKQMMDYPGGNEKLRPFQRADVEFMKRVPRLINANKMGVGKTVESLQFAAEMNFERVIVFCRKSKMLDWKEEAEKWVGPSVAIVRGTPRQKRYAWDQRARITIMSYGALRIVKNKKTGEVKYNWPELFQEEYELSICDEAHWLKSTRAQQTRGASQLRTQYLHLLTGSPMKDKPTDIFALLTLIEPYRWTSLNVFIERFCEYEVSYFGGKNFVGLKNVATLQYILSSIMLDRKKEDVLPQLPSKIYKRINVELDTAQRKYYDEMEKTMMITTSHDEKSLMDFLNDDDEDNIIADNSMSKMVRLRQICNSPELLGLSGSSAKLEAVIDSVIEAVESGEKVVVFYVFNKFGSLISNELNKLNIIHSLINGQISEKQMDAAKLKFRDDPNCMVMLSTLGTGSEGLNLQNASVLIFADKPWTPGDLEQAEDRIHRDGQKVHPLIISIVCKDTVEEYIEDLLATKGQTISKAMALKYLYKRLEEKAI